MAPPRTAHRRTAAALGVVLAGALGGCAIGSGGPSETRDVEVGDVRTVDLATAGDLTVRRGDRPGLTITAGARTQDRLVVEERDGVLHLGASSELFGRLGDIEYELVLPRVEEVAASGSGDVELVDVTGDRLRVLVGGSGSVSASGVEADRVDVTIEGSGDVELAGRAATANLSIEGSGALDLADLRLEEANVSVEGSGDVEVDVRDRLTVSISGSGTVSYTGDPRVEQDIEGSGSVERG